jgi:hypothetical protein
MFYKGTNPLTVHETVPGYKLTGCVTSYTTFIHNVPRYKDIFMCVHVNYVHNGGDSTNLN